jgi:hypothetical protein
MFENTKARGRRMRALIRICALTVLASLALGAIGVEVGLGGYGTGGGGGGGYDDEGGGGYGEDGGGYGEDGEDDADDTAPVISVRKPALLNKKLVIKRGVVLGVKCSEACRLKATITFDRRSAKRLGWSSPSAPIGSGRATMATWWDSVKLPLNAKARKALKKSRSAVALVVTITAVDEDGNAAKPVTQTVAVG